jgi:hypothetical protein
VKATTMSQQTGIWKPNAVSRPAWGMRITHGETRVRKAQITASTPSGEATARLGSINRAR